MAITDYSSLKTGIQNWTARTDTNFTDRIDDFIDSAENRIFYGFGEPGDRFYSPPLRILAMENTGDLTISSGTAAVPTGWLESIRLYLNTSPKDELEYYPPARFWETTAAASATTGPPKIYTMEGTNFRFAPVPDDSYTGKLSYYKKLDALSGSNTTNWLITNAPMVYLYGSLVEFGIWDMNDQTTSKYFDLYSGMIKSLMSQDRKARNSGAFLRIIADATP